METSNIKKIKHYFATLGKPMTKAEEEEVFLPLVDVYAKCKNLQAQDPHYQEKRNDLELSYWYLLQMEFGAQIFTRLTKDTATNANQEQTKQEQTMDIERIRSDIADAYMLLYFKSPLQRENFIPHKKTAKLLKALNVIMNYYGLDLKKPDEISKVARLYHPNEFRYNSGIIIK